LKIRACVMKRMLSFIIIFLCMSLLFLSFANAEGEDVTALSDSIAGQEELKKDQEKKSRAYYDLGVFAYEDADYKDAEENLLKALEFLPGNPSYNHFLGKIYLKTEQYSEAEIFINKAWNVKPELPGLEYDMIWLF